MKAIMTCGGTGGHIYPAIAIANKIKEHDPEAEIMFIGTKHGMENRLVPEAGYRIEGVDASGIDRKNLLKNVKTVEDFIRGGIEAERIIRGFAPDIVVGTGGYVTGTVVRQAAKQGIPCYIHEQNAFPGIANKMLERYVEKVFISFPEAASYFKSASKMVYTGNPIRSEFVSMPRTAHQGFKLLVCGGSLGAEMINKSAIELIKRRPDLKIDFVTGRRYYESIKSEVGAIEGSEDFVNLIDYENDMPGRMAQADMVISRSGAITLSEILAMGLPTIFIPSPNVTGNHQYHNAKSVADAGAALLIEEKELIADIGVVADKVTELAEKPAQLAEMGRKARSVARLDAADIIWTNISRQKQ